LRRATVLAEVEKGEPDILWLARSSEAAVFVQAHERFKAEASVPLPLRELRRTRLPGISGDVS
jgi:hypothetical protein